MTRTTDLTHEHPSPHADLRPARTRTGWHLQLTAPGVKVDSDLTHDSEPTAPPALGIALMMASLTAAVPAVLLAVLGWMFPIPGQWLALLASALFLTVFLTCVLMIFYGLRTGHSFWLTRAKPTPNGGTSNGTPNGTGNSSGNGTTNVSAHGTGKASGKGSGKGSGHGSGNGTKPAPARTAARKRR
jgi:hypothetical protein